MNRICSTSTRVCADDPRIAVATAPQRDLGKELPVPADESRVDVQIGLRARAHTIEIVTFKGGLKG